MSHFPVLVIGGNHEEQLMPFYEELRTDFYDLTEEYENEYKTKSLDVVELADGKQFSKYAKEIQQYWKLKNEKDQFGGKELMLPEGATLKTIPFKEFYPTLEVFAEEWHGTEPDDCGRYGYWYNPRAKWDWYQLGGRWENFLPLKNGIQANEAKWSDVDTDKIETPFAVLKNGHWYQQGEMGWWGIVSEEKEAEVWEKEFRNLIKNIKPNTPVALVDCHI